MSGATGAHMVYGIHGIEVVGFHELPAPAIGHLLSDSFKLIRTIAKLLQITQDM